MDDEKVLLVIAKPEVYKSPEGNCYIVFGEVSLASGVLASFPPVLIHAPRNQAKVEDQGGLIAASQQQQFVQQQMAQQAAEKQAALANKSSEKKKEGQADDEEEDDGPADATGLKEADIELVMSQANCSKDKAIKSLRKAKGDLGQLIFSALHQLAADLQGITVTAISALL